HGRDLRAVRGIVVHDTVTRKTTSDQRVAELLYDGRSDLAGPLAQVGVSRDGSVWVISDGRANHNGFGRMGNDTIGIEVFARGGVLGEEESWTAAATDAVVKICVGIREHLPGIDVWGHRETDPSRKIDPWGVDLDRLRVRVGEGDMGLSDDDKGWIRGLILDVVRQEGVSGAADASASSVDEAVVAALGPRLERIEERIKTGDVDYGRVAVALADVLMARLKEVTSSWH
ncbi:MAG: peptidoglycan recognition protein family protein, partial [bacterium]